MRIEELLDGLNKRYVLKGADLLISCVNPEHDDSNPSMRVDRVTGVYHCFACGTKGNLLREYGHTPSILDTRTKSIKAKIQRLLAGDLVIPDGAMPFLHEHRGISPKTYAKYGAFTHTDYEGRIVFPIRNYSDGIYAFLGRYTHSEASPKYKVYPENTPLQLYPTKPRIYKGTCILVEGLFDVLNLNENGMDNVITGFGTSTLYKKANEMLEPLFISGMDKLYIMFDGDDAGAKSAAKLKSLIHEKYHPEVVTLPEGSDPGSLDANIIQQIKEGLYS
jgi:DNA primase